MGKEIHNRCMSCKEQRKIVDGEVKKMKNGAYMYQGKCEVCSKGMSKILSKADANEVEQSE